VYYALFLVGGEAGFFDDIVKFANSAYFQEGKFGIAFVSGRQNNLADTDNAIDQASAKFQIDYAEHIKVIDASVEYPATVFDAIKCDFVIRHF
jgi:hypothetical protein